MQRIRVYGSFFRLVDARDADAILETGPGFAYGGRYAPPGEFGTLDLGELPEVCWREKLRQVGGRAERLPQQRLGEIMVDLPRVLDLTDSRTLDALGTAAARLTDALDRTFTHPLGRSSRALGYDALLAPSAAGPGRNLIVFRDRLPADASVTLLRTTPAPAPNLESKSLAWR